MPILGPTALHAVMDLSALPLEVDTYATRGNSDRYDCVDTLPRGRA